MVKDKVEYLAQTKEAIKTAIRDRGVAVEDTEPFRSYAEKIGQIIGFSKTETLPEQTVLIANSKYEPNGIELLWTDVGAAGYKILRKENSEPLNSSDGTVIYTGIATEITDSNVEIGKTYFYRIFPYNTSGQFQAMRGLSVVKVEYADRTGQTTINDLLLGDLIKFGEYGGSLFTWKVVDTQDKDKGYITVAAEQNLGNLQFDVQENSTENPNPVTNRKNQGNNRWLYSNARQILNSDGAKGEWWTAQHEYDVKPNYAEGNAGFLNAFTEFEKNVILPKTNRCILDDADGGGSETMIDKVWLPSTYAMALEIFQPLEDEHTYEAFTSNEERAYQSNYWTRTINGKTSGNGVRLVGASGSLGNGSASFNIALRPFCLLPTSAYIAWSDSDNAYYFADDSQRNAVI